MQARVSQLKQQLENLFPGKWLAPTDSARYLQTGLSEIDSSVTRGIARKRIAEWTGAVSSGKTSLLRAAIANWCAAGLNVAYVDVQGRLFASDWADVGNERGKLWIIRQPEHQFTPGQVVPLVSKRTLALQEAVWSADQFIRLNAFDVVVLDLGSLNLYERKRGAGVRAFARLQRSLDRSKAALIVVRDTDSLGDTESWGINAKFNFNWGATIRCEAGLAGNVLITPAIKCNIVKDGISQTVEVSVGSSVKNRMFTHSQVPDRRTSKG
jgi:hypothetical protein